jgi:hypothetical protein
MPPQTHQAYLSNKSQVTRELFLKYVKMSTETGKKMTENQYFLGSLGPEGSWGHLLRRP